MKLRWRWLIAVALLAIALLWQFARPRTIALPLFNRSDEAATLTFHGEGLAQPATAMLIPHGKAVVTLVARRAGALRIRVATSRSRNDALLADVQSLRATRQHFEIRDGNVFVLVPDVDPAQ